MTATDNRVIGVDLLKISAMLLIVLLHLLSQGGIVAAYESGTAGYILTQSLHGLTFFAVNCYALCSGFLCYKSKTRYSRIAAIWLQTFFYSVLIYLCFVLSGRHAFEIKDFIKFLLPVLTDRYWYVTAYFLLFLFMPIINVAIDKMSRRAYRNLLLGLFIFTVCGAVLFLAVFFRDPFRFNRGYSAMWLVVLYLFGAYIGKYEVGKNIKTYKLAVSFFALLVGAIGLKLALNLLGVDKYNDLFVSYVSPINFLLAMLFFMLCLKIDFRNAKARKVVATLSSATLGVFLIHAHPLIRESLTPKLVFLTEHGVAVTVAGVLALTVLVFLICSAIDILRAKLFKAAKVDNLLRRIDDKINFNG